MLEVFGTPGFVAMARIGGIAGGTRCWVEAFNTPGYSPAYVTFTGLRRP